jgi:hypothetical protein
LLLEESQIYVIVTNIVKVSIVGLYPNKLLGDIKEIALKQKKQ